MSAFRKSQTGVALVMAMMIVALITVIAVEVSWRFELNISRSANRWAGVQAKAYLEGAEQMAMLFLREDAEGEETGEVDSLMEDWASDLPPFPTDHGWLKGKIEDAHGRFNLNTMQPIVGNCRDGRAKPQRIPCPPPVMDCDYFTPAQRMFIRLMQTFNLGDEEEPIYVTQEEAKLITEAVIDWLDADSNITGFGGAESDHYEALDNPVTIANKEMVSVSELQVVRGMIPKLYQALLPYIIALPVKEVPKININTAQVPVLRTFTSKQHCALEPMTLEEAQEVSDFLSGGEFTKLADLKSDLGIPAVWNATGQNGQADFDEELIFIGQSSYFLFFGEVGIGDDHVRRGAALIKREGGGGGAQPPVSGSPNAATATSSVKIEVVRRTDANF